MQNTHRQAVAAALLALSASTSEAHAQTSQTAARPPLSAAVQRFVVVDAPIVALTHVRVVDGSGQPARNDQTILIRADRIVAVGAFADVSIPSAARVLDLSGATAIPGIVGMHEHTYFETDTRVSQMAISGPRLYLANGVTTIRTAGAMFPYAELNMKRAIDAGDAIGPRMFITGPYLNARKDGGSPERQLRDEAETRRVIDYWADEGATWLKFMGNISRALLAAGIDEAHRRGLKVTGHLCSVTFREAAALGIDNLEHGLITNSDYIADKKPDVCPPDNMKKQAEVDIDGGAVRATFHDLIAHHVALTSTLSVYELFVPGRAKLNPRALDALAPEVRREVEASNAALSDTSTFSVAPAFFQKMMRYDREFVRAGGLLVAGVDPWGNGSLPGYGDLRNYELLVEAGFTAEQAIQIMTANGAKLLGEIGQRGTIEKGKIADLAIIDGNPVATPSDIYKMRMVFRDGVGFDSAKLIESVKGKVGIW